MWPLSIEMLVAQRALILLHLTTPGFRLLKVQEFYDAQQDRCTRTAAARFDFERVGSSEARFVAGERSRRRSVSSNVGHESDRIHRNHLVCGVGRLCCDPDYPRRLGRNRQVLDGLFGDTRWRKFSTSA